MKLKSIMMMRTILTILFAGFFIPVFAQTGKLFKGTVNNSKITLCLQGLDEGTHADRILGAYKYDNQKEYILLNGYVNNKGNIVFAEQANPNFSGVFLGTITGNQIKGKWISADQAKTYNFQLQKFSATKEQLQIFQDAIAKKASEFSNY